MDESSQGEDKATYSPTFEETYRRHEFAELVRLAVAAGAWLVKMRRRVQSRPPDLSPGEMSPAE